MSLTQTVRQIMDTTSLSDPREIAAKLLADISPDEYRAALEEALPPFVRTALSRDRLAQTGSKSGPSRSGKLAAIRDHWERRLATPLLVNGAYKRFGECDASDLHMAAEALRADAARMTSKADYYDEIAAALPAGATVSALDADPTEAVAA